MFMYYINLLHITNTEQMFSYEIEDTTFHFHYLHNTKNQEE